MTVSLCLRTLRGQYARVVLFRWPLIRLRQRGVDGRDAFLGPCQVHGAGEGCADVALSGGEVSVDSVEAFVLVRELVAQPGSEILQAGDESCTCSGIDTGSEGRDALEAGHGGRQLRSGGLLLDGEVDAVPT